MKKIVALLLMLILVACGGGGGGGEGGGSGDSKNLSVAPNLSNLYKQVMTNLPKGQYESTIDYESRLNTYTSSLTGYHATVKVNVSYNADTKILKIRGLPSTSADITEGVASSAALYTGYTRLDYGLDFIIPHEHDYSETPTIYSDGPYYTEYYKIIAMDAITAQRISDGFRVDYTFAFPPDVVRSSGNHCVSAWFTNCINYLDCNIATYRVYNVIDGKEY